MQLNPPNTAKVLSTDTAKSAGIIDDHASNVSHFLGYPTRLNSWQLMKLQQTAKKSKLVKTKLYPVQFLH